VLKDRHFAAHACLQRAIQPQERNPYFRYRGGLRRGGPVVRVHRRPHLPSHKRHSFIQSVISQSYQCTVPNTDLSLSFSLSLSFPLFLSYCVSQSHQCSIQLPTKNKNKNVRARVRHWAAGAQIRAGPLCIEESRRR